MHMISDSEAFCRAKVCAKCNQWKLIEKIVCLFRFEITVKNIKQKYWFQESPQNLKINVFFCYIFLWGLL